MSYEYYLKVMGLTDSRTSWVMWKVYACNMKEREAKKVSLDPVWGYKPLKGKRENA